MVYKNIKTQYRHGDHCYIIEDYKVKKLTIYGITRKYYSVVDEYNNDREVDHEFFDRAPKFKVDALELLMFKLEYMMGECYAEISMLKTKYKLNGTTKEIPDKR